MNNNNLSEFEKTFEETTALFRTQESVFYGFARGDKRNLRAYRSLCQLAFQLGVYLIEESGEYFVRQVGSERWNERIIILGFGDFFTAIRWGFIFNIQHGISQALYEQACYIMADYAGIVVDDTPTDIIIEYNGIVLAAFDAWDEAYQYLVEVENEQQARLLAYGLVRVIKEAGGTVSGQAKSLLGTVDRRLLRVDGDFVVIIQTGVCFGLTQTWTIAQAIALTKALRY